MHTQTVIPPGSQVPITVHSSLDLRRLRDWDAGCSAKSPIGEVLCQEFGLPYLNLRAEGYPAIGAPRSLSGSGLAG